MCQKWTVAGLKMDEDIPDQAFIYAASTLPKFARLAQPSSTGGGDYSLNSLTAKR